MPEAAQLEFPFPTLDFAGRQTITPDEIGAKLGVTTRHVLDLIEEGRISAIDLAGKGASRRFCKIPIESYRDFILASMTGPRRRVLLAGLPKPTLRALAAELRELIAA